MDEGEPALWPSTGYSSGQPGDDWPSVGGLFLFVFRDPEEDRWVPLFVDQTESLAASLPTHPRWPEAVRIGATHVHVIRQHDPLVREDAKALIIRNYQPRMNFSVEQST